MINGELEREISSLEIKNETPPLPQIIETISLYNQIPRSKEKERKKLLKQVDEIVATILSEGETCAKELRGEHVQEAVREVVKGILGELDAAPKTTAESADSISKGFSCENDLLTPAQKIDALEKDLLVLSGNIDALKNDLLLPAKKIDAFKNDLRLLPQKTDVLENDLLVLTQKINALKNDPLVPAEKIDALENDLRDLAKKIDALKNIPLVLAQKIDALQKKNANLKKQKGITHDNSLTDAIRENENQIQKLKELKTKILKKEIAECLKTPYGQEIQQALQNIILDIQEEHAKQKISPYTHDALVTLIYEFIYEGYLWKDKKRKDGKTSYFLSHLTDAIRAYIHSGFTSLARLLAELKHDSIEDLTYHRENCDPESKKLDPKKKWLFCPELYKDKFKDKPTENRPLPSDKYLEKVINNAYITILSVTNPDNFQKKKEILLNRKKKDQSKLKKFFEQIVHHYGYPVVTKIFDQQHNIKTLGFLEEDRIEEKLDLMLKNFAILAKMLRLESPYRTFVGAGIDHHRPKLRKWFYDIQKKRMEQIMKFDKKKTEESFLEKILKPNWSTRIKNALRSILNPSSESPQIEQMLQKHLAESAGNKIQTNILATRNKIQAAFHPGRNEIVSIEIIPSALEDYIDDIEELQNSTDYPRIEPNDPLFEIRILVKSPQDIQPIDEWIYHVTGGHTYKDKNRAEPAPYPPDCYKGVSFTLQNNIRVRINDIQHENLMKRGVLADRSKSIPDDLRDRLIEALQESKTFGTPHWQVIQEKVLRNNIEVITKGGDRILLPKGSTSLDLAASLPEKKAIEAFIYAKKIRVQESDPQNPFKELEEGKTYDIEISTTPTFEIGMIPFCATPRYRKILSTFLKKEAEKLATQKKSDPKKCLREIAQEQTDGYLQKLTNLFFANNHPIQAIQDFLVLLAMDTLYTCPLDDPLLQTHLTKLKNLRAYQNEIKNDSFLPTTFKQDVRDRKDSIENSIEKRIHVLKTWEPWKKKKLLQKYEQQKEKARIQIGLGKFDLLKAISLYLNRKLTPENMPRLIDCDSELDNHFGVLHDMSGEIKKKKINIEHIHKTDESLSTSTANVKMSLEFPEKMNSYEILKFFLKLSYDKEMVKDIKVNNVETFSFPEYLPLIHKTIQEWQMPQSQPDQTSPQ